MKDRQKNWTWITTDLKTTDEEWKRKFAQWRASGIDAILPELFNSREAFYASEHLPVGGEWLERILPIAKAEGLEIHAWMWTMPCDVQEVREEHPEWFDVNRRGESSLEKPVYVSYYKFLCPSRPEVHAFLQKRVRELAQYDELDGIHLDYIRHPDVILPVGLQPRYGIVQDREYPEYDYCYCDVCRRDFKEKSGMDPLELEDPSCSEEWRQFRYDLITNIVHTQLVPIGRKHNKAMTAAVFPNWEYVRQEWRVWNIDGVLPMLYHSFYNGGVDWIAEQTQKGIQSLKKDIPLYSGLFVPRLTPDDLSRAIAASLRGGASGVSLFSAGAMSDAHWERFRKASWSAADQSHP